VGFRVRRDDAPGGRDVGSRLAGWGLEPRSWNTHPGDTFGWHDHPQHKILYCVRGSITFHGRNVHDMELRPGDRLDIEARTQHAATVGPEGVECTEAFAAAPPEGSA
jgi:quercetin dioxygenase-like cupin family protein